MTMLRLESMIVAQHFSDTKMSLQREEQDHSPAEVVSVDHCCGLAQSRFRKQSRYHSFSLKRILAAIEIEC